MPTSETVELSDEKLLTPAELADELGISVGTLKNWRYHGRGEGPPYVHVGGRVRYTRPHIREWLASLEVHA